MKFLLTSLFLFLGCVPIYSQARIDSLIAELPQHTGETKVNILNKLTNWYSCKSKQKALMYYEQTREELSQLDYLDGEVLAYNLYGNIMNCSGSPDSALIAYQKALALTEGQKDMQAEVAKINANIALIYLMNREMDKGLEKLLITRKIGLELNDNDLIIGTNYNIARIYEVKRNFDSAYIMYQDVIDRATETGDEESVFQGKYGIFSLNTQYNKEKVLEEDFQEMLTLAKEKGRTRARNSIAIVAADYYIEHEDWEKALAHIHICEVTNQELQDKTSDTYVYDRYARVYAGMEKWEKAVENNKKAIDGTEAIKKTASLPILYSSHASYLLKLNKAKEAVAAAKKSLEYAETLDDRQLENNRFRAYQPLGKAYQLLGNHKEAASAYRKYIETEAEHLAKYQANQFTELQTKYETAKKEAEIKDLSQQASIQELELDKRNQWLAIGGVSLLLLLAIGLVAYYRAQQNQVQAKAATAEIEQRFLRSQLNPHFIFNALDSIQNYMLDHDAPKASLYMSKFAKLMRQVLENSREKFISLTEEVKMLENYMELQKLQANTDFAYEIELDEEIDEEDFAIPPMFVQPFVENAIEHGVIQGKGLIHVHFHLENKLVNITVTDNGVGLSESRQIQHQRAKTHKSLATSIIKERIESYNEKLKTNIELLVSEMVGDNQQIVGTQVLLKVPYQLS